MKQFGERNVSRNEVVKKEQRQVCKAGRKANHGNQGLGLTLIKCYLNKKVLFLFFLLATYIIETEKSFCLQELTCWLISLINLKKTHTFTPSIIIILSLVLSNEQSKSQNC